MAINEQAFNPEAPPFARSSPKAYYAWLTSNGYPHRVAYDQTVGIFGPPKTQAEIDEAAAKQKQQAGLAQAGGAIVGSIITNEAMRGFPTIGGLFSSGAGGTTAVAQPTLLGGAGATGAGATGAGATGAGATGAGATGAGAAGASTLGTIGAVALPVAAIALAANNAWETGMKDIVRGRGTREDWINQGVNMIGGAAPNLALRLMGKRSIGAMMTSGKSNAQALRDDFRGDLKQSGVADKDYMVTLADGSKFNIGLDGKTKYKNIDEKTTRNAWDVDFSNPLAKFATDKIDPMIRGIYGADNSKAKFFPGQYTGMLVNAATSNAKNEAEVMANIETMLGKSKFAEQAGVGITPPKPQRPPKGQVVRVSPGMYMNDKGQVGPAKTVRQALSANYKKTEEKK
jgi:hypothetical protein